MSSARAAVLLWAQRVIARKGSPAHQILEIASDAGVDAAQDAFHKIARMAHPDLHRTLAPEELELVTSAYARAAAAYQELRKQAKGTSTSRMRPVRAGTEPPTVSAAPAKAGVAKTTGAIAASHARTTGSVERINPSQAMTSKALIHYRKAELALRRGDLTAAILQLKMAIASDPQSAFLRTALSEVETEVGKKP